MADRTNGGSSNTAIVAIVVVILVAIVAFLFFFRPTDAPEPQDAGPDIELEVNPPADDGAAAGADTSAF